MLASVTEQYELQRELTEFGAAAARRAWRLGRLDLLPVTLATLMARAAVEAEASLDAVLAEQGLSAPPSALLQTTAFGQSTSSGFDLLGLLIQAPTVKILQSMAVTQIADSWRVASGASMATRPALQGYVRHVGPTCCSRCAILSGRFYRWSSGFERHPNCRCVNIPTTIRAMDAVSETPEELFHQGRIRGLSKANQRAIEDGADIIQITNAYRRTSGMSFAQVSPIKRGRNGDKFTTEGTTLRGLAGLQQLALRRNGKSQMRLMPESIYRTASSHEDAIRLLTLYGWIKDDAAVSRGRDLAAEQRRLARNTRARERRARQAA